MARRRGTIWSNVRWIHPRRTGYGTGPKALLEMLRYFEYRDDRNTPAPKGGRRWIDRGMGSNQRQIFENCRALSSDDRLAWSLMISPKPRLLALIEDEETRRDLVQELSADVIEEWFTERGFQDADFSLVLHDRATNETGESQVHAHLILPGTVETVAGRERLSNGPDDLRAFNRIVEDQFEVHMDRRLGRAWRARWAEIQREEALQKYFTGQGLERSEWPDTLPELAETLHRAGQTVEAIPPEVTNPAELQVWLDGLDGGDLDLWFGEVSR